MYLDELGEERLIRRLAKKFSIAHPRLVKGIGDDTSVSVQKSGSYLLSTTDTLTGGVHFRTALTTPELLGGKALAVSLSDIAAMGGTPLIFLVSLSLPPKTERKFLDRLYRGMLSMASKHGCALAGGNVSRSSVISVTTTVIGEAPERDVVYRKGARAGDTIYVTGVPGLAALGLEALKKYGLARARRGPYREAVARHLCPAPRLEAGRAIARRRLATAMIDVSDGVLLDLQRLCAESNVGADVELERMPVHECLEKWRLREGGDTTSLALSGGEDYELLFTAPAKKAGSIKRLSDRLGLKITAIGSITSGKKVRVLGPGKKTIRIKKAGFLHF